MNEEVVKAFVAEVTGEKVEDITVVSVEATVEPTATTEPPRDMEHAKRNRARVHETVNEMIEKMESALPKLKELQASLARPMEELSKEEGRKEMMLTLMVLLHAMDKI